MFFSNLTNTLRLQDSYCDTFCKDTLVSWILYKEAPLRVQLIRFSWRCSIRLNGNITLHYAIPMPNWSSAIYYKGNLFIYEIITWHVEQTISLLIRFFSRD